MCDVDNLRSIVNDLRKQYVETAARIDPRLDGARFLTCRLADGKAIIENAEAERQDLWRRTAGLDPKYAEEHGTDNVLQLAEEPGSHESPL